jgi:rhamnose transport system permease protein
VFWQNLGLPLPLADLPRAIASAPSPASSTVLIITRFRVPPLIATLATLALYRGLAEGISRRARCAAIRNGSMCWARARCLACRPSSGCCWSRPSSPRSSSAYTRWGRTTYAIGSNEVAARFSGLSVEGTKLAIYTASGFAAALAAVIFVSRVSTTRSDMGTGIELDAITAVVLGGTSIFGGRGTIIGTMHRAHASSRR